MVHTIPGPKVELDVEVKIDMMTTERLKKYSQPSYEA